MRYNAVIKNYQFHPMAELVPSILKLWADIPSLDLVNIMLLDEKGTIKQLSYKFKFVIVNNNEWNFGNIKGKSCIVEEIDRGFKFVSFFD